jgi:hypothetical protein
MLDPTIAPRPLPWKLVALWGKYLEVEPLPGYRGDLQGAVVAQQVASFKQMFGVAFCGADGHSLPTLPLSDFMPLQPRTADPNDPTFSRRRPLLDVEEFRHIKEMMMDGPEDE